jgi:hypothetical protein
VLVGGVLTSVLLGLVSYFVAKDYSSSVIIGLLSVVIALQLDVIGRVDARHDRDDQHSQLLAALETVPWLLPLVNRIGDAVSTVAGDSRLEPLTEVARRELERCDSRLQGLRLGQYRVPASDVEVLFDQTQHAERLIQATSVATIDLKWWHSQVGRKYWDTQVEALRRGVRIERSFIYETWSEPLQALAQEQAEAGVRVMAVPKDAIADELRVDMIIWDESFAYEIELNSDGVEIYNRYTVNHAELDQRLGNFRSISACSSPVDRRTGDISSVKAS